MGYVHIQNPKVVHLLIIKNFNQVQRLIGTLVHRNSTTYLKVAPQRKSVKRPERSICLTVHTFGTRTGPVRNVVWVIGVTILSSAEVHRSLDLSL